MQPSSRLFNMFCKAQFLGASPIIFDEPGQDYVLRFRSLTNANNSEGPQKVFRDPGFPLFEARDSGFERKIGRSFGIKSMPGRWDSKNNARDYGIARNFGSGLGDWKTLLGTLNNATNLSRWFP